MSSTNSIQECIEKSETYWNETYNKMLVCLYNKEWDWDNLTDNVNYSEQHISHLKIEDFKRTNPLKPFDASVLAHYEPLNYMQWFELSRDPSITFDIVRNTKHKPWSWIKLSKNQNITEDILREFIKRAWDWREVSRNPCITLDIVLRNRTWKWDWCGLSQNESITCEQVLENPDLPWNWYWLSQNRMSVGKKQFICNHTKKQLQKKRYILFLRSIVRKYNLPEELMIIVSSYF